MKDQIFKAVFGSDWERLPIVFQKRYMHHPYSNDQFTVEGTMDIYLSKWMLFFAPIFKLFRTLVPYQGKAVPVVVNFHSQTDSDGVYLDRTFYFPGKKPYSFNSCMRVIKGNDVVERMSLGLGWRSHYFYDGKKNRDAT